MKQAKIAVLKTKPENVLKDYDKIMHLVDYKKTISKRYETILKLNLSWSLYFPSCSTQPWQLEGVMKTLLKDGYEKKKIHLVENQTVVTKPWKGAKENKWLPLLQKYKIPFEPLTETEWVKYKPKHEMLALNHLFPNSYQIPKMFVGKNVIHLPTFKCHGHTTITGSMKNAFGGLITKKRHHSHKVIHKILVDLLHIQKGIHKGIFTIMDGTVCGNGAGPRTMQPVVKNYIAAGSDSVAIDAIEAKMMGFEPLKIPFIKIAHDKGLGCGDVDQIDIVGEDISKVNFGFHTGKSPVVFFDQMFRKKLKFVEPLLFHTPLFKLCIMASGVYHDYIWYPTKGKKVIKRFNGTGWGKLFQSY